MGYISYGVGWNEDSRKFTVREQSAYGAVLNVIDSGAYPTFSEAYEKARAYAKAHRKFIDDVHLIPEERCKEKLKGSRGMSAAQKAEIGDSEELGSSEPGQGREDPEYSDVRPFWAEIRNDYFCTDIFEEEGDLLAYITIDAWKTEDENEQGDVIACVMLTEHGDVVVDYRDRRALYDNAAQELIQDAIESLKTYYLEYEQNKTYDDTKSYGYKNEENFKKYPDEVCYIPENWDFDDGPGISGRDIVQLCGGDKLKAEVIFNLCSWQFPSTVLDEWDQDDERAFQELKRERHASLADKINAAEDTRKRTGGNTSKTFPSLNKKNKSR